MADHTGEKLTPREMVRAHAYPVLAGLGALSLVAIALLQIPGAIKAHRYNQCVDEQVGLRRATNLAVQYCEGL